MNLPGGGWEKCSHEYLASDPRPHLARGAAPQLSPVFIYINVDIVYHKEILASLLVGDEIVVVGHKADGYIMDTASGEGSMSGTWIEKGESAIYVKNSEGKTVKFTPEWHDGGLDAAMLAQFQELAVGASITVKWKLDERKRAISISLN